MNAAWIRGGLGVCFLVAMTVAAAGAADTEESGNWMDRIKLSGAVEVEASYSKADFNDAATDDETASDIDLAAVELNIDATVADNVDGHVLIKYGDDDLFLDEGYVVISGLETIPVSLTAGRQYIPFGRFDTHFISDPTTLFLGETNEGAAVVGYTIGEDLVELAVGAFNGKVSSTDNDEVDSVVASVTVQPLEWLAFGGSYTSNLAGSDGLSEQVIDANKEIKTLVGGWSGFVSVALMERLTIFGEYTTAVEEFEAGELYDGADTKKRQPSAYNIEVGFQIIEALGVAVRYEGSEDGDAGAGEFLPESQYGAVVNWGLFENTNLALEYLHGEYEGDYQKTDTITAQLAVEF